MDLRQPRKSGEPVSPPIRGRKTSAVFRTHLIQSPDARGEGRLQRVQLRFLEGELLPGGSPPKAMARALRDGIFDRGAERHLLQASYRGHVRPVVRGDAPELRILGEGESVPHARETAAGAGAAGRALFQKGAAPEGEAFRRPVAISTEFPVRTGAVCPLPPGAPQVFREEYAGVPRRKLDDGRSGRRVRGKRGEPLPCGLAPVPR